MTILKDIKAIGLANQAVFKNIESQTGISRWRLKSKSRKEDVVYARYLFVQEVKSHMKINHIAELLNIHRTSVYHYLYDHQPKKKLVNQFSYKGLKK